MGWGLLPGHEANWDHTAYVHMAKLSSSPEQGSCVWDLSDAKLLCVHKNHTRACAVSPTMRMFSC